MLELTFDPGRMELGVRALVTRGRKPLGKGEGAVARHVARTDPAARRRQPER